MVDNLKHIEPKFRKMLAEAKRAILSVEPKAEVYLFGSRARGDFNEESDWDLLVLLPGKVDWGIKSNIIGAIHDVEMNYFEIFNLVIKDAGYWTHDRLYHATPFYKNVSVEKVEV